MKRKNYMFIPVIVMAVALAFTGCSSSGGDDGGPASASAVSIGAMTKGSVIVNGVTFEDNAARITGDDTTKVPANLQTGMTVKVRGRINADGVNGTAERIEIENEVRGALTKTGADTFTVHAQTVLVDGATVFANVANFAGLSDGNNVEVHGQRDALGVIRATRVETTAVVDDEVRGTVSGLTGNLILGGPFTIGTSTLSISTNATTSVTPAGAVIANGTLVEVHLSGNTATRIHVEDADNEFEPAEGEEFEVEGLISGFSPGATTFKVGGESVQITSSTRFEGGLKDELLDDLKVEAEGHNRSNGALVAEKITFKENIRIEAIADAAGSANALGLTVKTTSKTRFEGGLVSEASITTGDGLRVRGFLNLDGTITATRVILQNPDSNGRSILQGPALEVNAQTKTMKIAGITITMATGASSFDDSISADDNVPFASVDDFFAAISAKKMIVKAKGIFSSGSIAASEIEIE